MEYADNRGLNSLYVYLSKILPLFVMPLGVALLLLLLAQLFLRRKWRKTAGGLSLAAFLVLWVFSMPIVADALYGKLESKYPPRPLERIPAADCLVLLGGALGAPMPPREDVDFSEAVDRVYKTAQLYKAGKARTVIVTGGNQPGSESRWAEAELMRDQLVEWGVPEKSIMLEGSSRNTRENAVYSRNIIQAIHCDGILLVTSAAHMPRAVNAFRGVNLEVTPVSTDIRVVNKGRLVVLDFLPSADALARSSEAIHELIGQQVYAIKGWN